MSAGLFATCTEAGFSVSLPADADQAFLVILRTDGRIDIDGPYERSTPSRALVSGEALYLVDFDRARLNALEPRFFRSDSGLELLPISPELAGDPSCEPHGHMWNLDGDRRIERSLASLVAGRVARVFRESDGRFVADQLSEAIANALALRYPIHDCRALAGLELTQFFDPLLEAPVGTSFHRHVGVGHLDRDTLVVGAQFGGVAVVQRGNSRPLHLWGLPTETSVPGARWLMVGLDLQRDGWPLTPARVLAVLIEELLQGPGVPALELRSRLVELEVSTSSISFVRELDERPGVEDRGSGLLQVSWWGEGFVAVGTDTIVHGERTSAPPTEIELSNHSPSSVATSSWPGLEVVIGASDGIRVGDIRRGFDSLRKETPFGTLDHRALAFSPGEPPTLYAGPYAARIARRVIDSGSTAVWSEIPIWPDGEGESCLQEPRCGRLGPIQNASSLEVGGLGVLASPMGEAPVFGLAECSAVWALLPEAGCALATPLPGGRIEFTPGESPVFFDASRFEDRLVLVGEDNLVVEARLLAP